MRGILEAAFFLLATVEARVQGGWIGLWHETGVSQEKGNSPMIQLRSIFELWKKFVMLIVMLKSGGGTPTWMYLPRFPMMLSPAVMMAASPLVSTTMLCF